MANGLLSPIGDFPIVNDTDISGGLHAVADVTARDAIPTERRKEGMRVRVNATSTSYRLGSGLGNGDWAEIAEPSFPLANSDLADMAANTVKVNATGSAASPTDLALGASTMLARLASGDIVAASTAQINTLLDAVTVTGTQTITGTKTYGGLGSGNVTHLIVRSAEVQSTKAFGFQDENGQNALTLGVTRGKLEWEIGAATTETGTAQAGTATTITLAAGESAQDDFYKSYTCEITAGTGSPGSAVITAYDGTTKVATVASWSAGTPDATSVYQLNLKRDLGFRFRDNGAGSEQGSFRVTNDAGQAVFTAGNGGVISSTVVTFTAQGAASVAGASSNLGFYGSGGGGKPTITGSRAGNAALADLLTELATLGLITDSSTA